MLLGLTCQIPDSNLLADLFAGDVDYEDDVDTHIEGYEVQEVPAEVIALLWAFHKLRPMEQ